MIDNFELVFSLQMHWTSGFFCCWSLNWICLFRFLWLFCACGTLWKEESQESAALILMDPSTNLTIGTREPGYFYTMWSESKIISLLMTHTIWCRHMIVDLHFWICLSYRVVKKVNHTLIFVFSMQCFLVRRLWVQRCRTSWSLIKKIC